MSTPTTTLNSQIPLLLRNFEVALRSGYNIKQAFEIVAKDLPAPLGLEAQKVVDEIEAGTPWPVAFEHMLQRSPSGDLDLVLATFLVQLEVGGNLADKLNLLSQIFDKRRLAK